MKKCYICKEEKEPDDFYKNKRQKDGLQTYCKECSNKRRTSYYLENKANESLKRKENKERIRHWFKGFKNNLKCLKCGEDHPATLQFHHLRNKEFSISDAVNHAFSIARIEKEMKKCIVLCANCHFKEHYK